MAAFYERPVTIQEVADEIAADAKRAQSPAGDGVAMRSISPRSLVSTPQHAHQLLVEKDGDGYRQKTEGRYHANYTPTHEWVQAWKAVCKTCGQKDAWVTAEAL